MAGKKKAETEEEPAHKFFCTECHGQWHTYTPGCFLERPPAGPPGIPWKNKVHYLCAHSGVANDSTAAPAATLKEAQELIDYWATWAPNSPNVIVEVATTYRYVSYKPKEKK